jgi:hypothetical protein
MSKKMKRGRKVSRRRMYGGSQVVAPAGLGDTSMNASSRMSMGQGNDYMRLHQGQHGGAAVSLAAAAPMGYTGMLDDSLRATARVGVLDQSMDAIQGMQDGGARRKKGRGRMNHKLIMAMLKKLGKRMGKTRRQRGGMPYALTQAQDYSTPGMLLSPSAERAAVGHMNPEWKLAADPGSFAPKM